MLDFAYLAWLTGLRRLLRILFMRTELTLGVTPMKNFDCPN
jgi:hypothetical protein